MNDPEPLYYGDKRIDALGEAIKNEVYNRCAGTNISAVTVIGLIEKVKLDLIMEFFKNDN